MSPSKDKNSPSTKFRFQAGSMWNCETSKITSKIILLLEALLHATLKGVNSDWTRLMGWSSRHEGEPSLTGPQFSGLLLLLLEVAWRKRIQLKVLGCCKLEVFSLIPSHMFKLQVFLSIETPTILQKSRTNLWTHLPVLLFEALISTFNPHRRFRLSEVPRGGTKWIWWWQRASSEGSATISPCAPDLDGFCRFTGWFLIYTDHICSQCQCLLNLLNLLVLIHTSIFWEHGQWGISSV